MSKVDMYMPLWIGDYLADTMHLSTVQHGAYILMLMAYWRKGQALANDDALLASITRLTISEWLKHKHTLIAFFELQDGQFVHGRVEKELAVAKDKRAKAKKSADARWHADEMLNGCERNANASLKHMGTQCSSESVLNTKSKPRTKVPTPDICSLRKSKIISDLAAKGIEL